MSEMEAQEQTQTQDQNPAPENADAGAAAPATPKKRKPRSDKGKGKKAKAKAKAKAIRIPVECLHAVVEPSDGSQFDAKLKAMTHSDAIAEVLALSASEDKDVATKWAGAKVQIVALVDEFTIDSKITVKTEIKR